MGEPSGSRGAGPEQAAREWLALSDAGRIEESWAHAATLFRRTLTAKSWSLEYSAVRAPLGAVMSRALSGVRTTHRMVGGPAGDYCVCRFRTRFAGQGPELGERVATMRDSDGCWRVVGYYVPAPWAPPRR